MHTDDRKINVAGKLHTSLLNNLLCTVPVSLKFQTSSNVDFSDTLHRFSPSWMNHCPKCLVSYFRSSQTGMNSPQLPSSSSEAIVSFYFVFLSLTIVPGKQEVLNDYLLNK